MGDDDPTKRDRPPTLPTPTPRKEPTAMKTWLTKFVSTIGDMLTSKKVLAALGTIASQVLVASPDARKGVLMAGIAYILGQGAADFGKSAKAMPAVPPPAAP